MVLCGVLCGCGCCGVCCGVVLCLVVSFCLVFFGAVLGWSWALKEGQKVMKNEPCEMLFGSQNLSKNDEKSLFEGSWRALGHSWGPRGRFEAPKKKCAFPPPNRNRLLERSWGGLGCLLGSSWGVLGGLWEVSGAIFLTLVRSWVYFGGTLVTKGFSDAFLTFF